MVFGKSVDDSAREEVEGVWDGGDWEGKVPGLGWGGEAEADEGYGCCGDMWR